MFGSYINDPDREMLSDLDVAMRFEKRFTDDQMQMKREEYRGENDLMYYDWPYQEVLKYLVNKSHYISICNIDRSEEQREIILGGPHICIEV